MIRRMLFLLSALPLGLALAQEEPSTQPSVAPPKGRPQPSPSAQAATEEVAEDYDVLFTLVARGKPPRYSTPEIQVYAGQIVALNFINDTPEGQSMILNWVLVEPGKARAVKNLGVNAGKRPGDTDYAPDVMAATGPVAPGESDAISFEAPRVPGRYPFLCNAPGCTSEMRGVLVVRPVS